MIINIRKALFTDIDHILEIEQESINSWTPTQFIQELSNEFSTFLVCEYNNSIAGYIIAWKIADEIQLNSIAVKRSFRKQGIGSRLLSEICKDDSGRSFTSVFLEVRSGNSDAIRFYTDNGFTKTGLREKYYNDDDAVLMEKKL
ncbi:MAG: ribosomal-protein-alanine N-acetyltransferase [Spirochaetae bacterium HGW-Spirochaetae-5]|nr:MAG: ribosomal-protein-alanine N-acetyltransferase [Spirochaetae bacterium HGW-Spirochaetae-5]